MNYELIRVLKQKAGEDLTEWGHDQFFNKELFAKLILAECAEVIRNQKVSPNLNHDHKEKTLETIGQHFGVTL